MTDLPVPFITGDILEADDLNKMNTSRTNDLQPIDNTTREVTNKGGSIGKDTAIWKVGYFETVETEDINVSGKANLSETFGDWTTTGYLKNTAYEADTDLFIVGYCASGNSSGTYQIKTDSASTPTTIVQVGGTERQIPFMCPVKKGDYWMVEEVTIAFSNYTINTLAFGV